MMSLLVASFAGLMISSQTSAVDPEIYVIQQRDGPTVYGYIRRDNGRMLEVESDSASDKGNKLYIPVAKVISRDVEPKSRRATRLQEQAEQEQKTLDERGLTTVAGQLKSKDEVAFANRAKAMVLARETSRPLPSQPAAPQAGDAPATVETPDAEAPGFFRQWGGHILIGVAGLALAAIVIKTLLL